MTAECRVKTIVDVTGLGQELGFSTNFITATPVLAVYIYDTAAITTEQPLDMSDIGTVEFIIIKNLDDTNRVDIDCNYTDTTFRANVQVDAGKTAMFKPSGSVYIKAITGACLIEYIVIGTA